METLIADGLRGSDMAAAKTSILVLSWKERCGFLGDGANLLFINGENLMPSFLAEQGKLNPGGYLANFVTALPHSYPQKLGVSFRRHCGTAVNRGNQGFANSGRGVNSSSGIKRTGRDNVVNQKTLAPRAAPDFRGFAAKPAFCHLSGLRRLRSCSETMICRLNVRAETSPATIVFTRSTTGAIDISLCIEA